MITAETKRNFTEAPCREKPAVRLTILIYLSGIAPVSCSSRGGLESIGSVDFVYRFGEQSIGGYVQILFGRVFRVDTCVVNMNSLIYRVLAIWLLLLVLWHAIDLLSSSGWFL